MHRILINCVKEEQARVMLAKFEEQPQVATLQHAFIYQHRNMGGFVLPVPCPDDCSLPAMAITFSYVLTITCVTVSAIFKPPVCAMNVGDVPAAFRVCAHVPSPWNHAATLLDEEMDAGLSSVNS